MDNLIIRVTGESQYLDMHIVQAHCSNAPVKTVYDAFTEEYYKYYDNLENSGVQLTDWTEISPESCKAPLSFRSTGLLNTEVLRLQYLRVAWYDDPPTASSAGVPQWSDIVYRGTGIVINSGGLQSTNPNFVVVYLYTPEGEYGGIGTVTQASQDADPALSVIFAIPWDDFKFFLEHVSDYDDVVEGEDIPETGIDYDPFKRGSGDLKGDQGKGSFGIGSNTLIGFKDNDSYGHHLYLTNASGRDELVAQLFRQDTQEEITDQNLADKISDKIVQETKYNKYLPEQGIISTHILPNELNPTATTPTNGIRTAGMILPVSNVYYANYQQTTKDFGTVNIDELWGNAFDYENCRVSVYLPFCGTVNLNPSSVLDGNIRIVYYCDTPTGNVTAAVYTVSKLGANQLITSVSGNCAYNIPVTGQSSNINSIRAASMQQIGSMLSSIVNLNFGDQSGKFLGIDFNTGDVVSQGSFGAQVGNLIGQNLLGKQYSTKTTGATGGDSVTCDRQIKIYLEQTVPVYPNNYKEIISIPTYGGGTVESGYAYTFGGEKESFPYSGYTKYQFVDVTGISNASDEEKAEIQRLLTQEGIYL